MKSKHYVTDLRSLSERFHALPIALFTTLALFAQGCATTKTSTSSHVENEASLRDSVSVLTERTVRPIAIPASRAVMTLSLDTLRLLVSGASFSERSGQAAVTLTKTEGGGIIASATCDSLTLLVESLKTEIFHLNTEKTAFKKELNETKIIEVNKPTGWQWFQIWTGRVLAAVVAGFAIFKFKIKN